MELLKPLLVVFLIVAVNGKFAEWNEWSSCTADCGSGIATRERMLPPYGSDHCYSAIVQEKACTGKSCTRTSNIARSKPTTASSNLYSKYPSSRAVDGNYNTMFNVKSCMHTGKDMEPFLRIDLQKKSLVEKVMIWNREDAYSSRLNNVYVTVGNDPEGLGNQVCGRLDNVTGIMKVDVLCGSILPGQYVHIRIPGQQFLTICEVEVIGAVLASVARGQAAAQSTNNGGNTANRAVDGNAGTPAQTMAGKKDPWLQINFGRERTICQLEIFGNGATVFNSTTISLGDDKNSTLNTLATVTEDLGKISKHVVNFVPCLTGQYLTLQQFGSNQMTIYELNAIGG